MLYEVNTLTHQRDLRPSNTYNFLLATIAITPPQHQPRGQLVRGSTCTLRGDPCSDGVSVRLTLPSSFLLLVHRSQFSFTEFPLEFDFCLEIFKTFLLPRNPSLRGSGPQIPVDTPFLTFFPPTLWSASAPAHPPPPWWLPAHQRE